MTQSPKQILEGIYRDMIAANKKAEASAAAYNSRSQEIVEEITSKAERTGQSRIFIEENIRSKKESDYELSSHFRGYTFQKGEVERLSILLQGIEAYKNISNSGLGPRT